MIILTDRISVYSSIHIIWLSSLLRHGYGSEVYDSDSKNMVNYNGKYYFLHQ